MNRDEEPFTALYVVLAPFAFTVLALLALIVLAAAVIV